MRNLLFCLVLGSFFISNCDGCKDCPDTLDFYLPVQVYGIKDTLHTGDTLRIRLEFPDKLADSNSGYMYDFINYNFQLVTYIDRLDTLPTGTDSYGTFNWQTVQGESKLIGSSEENLFVVLPSYSNHVYHYEIIATPKQKGLFVFGMNSKADRSAPLQELDGPCSKYPTNVYPKLENDTNSNFEFLKFSPEPTNANLDRKRFDDFAGFCFFVK